jgi:hypothetical protein
MADQYVEQVGGMDAAGYAVACDLLASSYKRKLAPPQFRTGSQKVFRKTCNNEQYLCDLANALRTGP